jgi:hypothetical protein
MKFAVVGCELTVKFSAQAVCARQVTEKFIHVPVIKCQVSTRRQV